jgi:hypothetical protein
MHGLLPVDAKANRRSVGRWDDRAHQKIEIQGLRDEVPTGMAHGNGGGWIWRVMQARQVVRETCRDRHMPNNRAVREARDPLQRL